MVRKLLSLFYSQPRPTLQHGLRPQRAPDYFIITASSIAQAAPGTYAGDITLVNWPQNDYMLGNLVDVSAAEAARHLDRAKQLSLSWLYWLQTECPRPDGGTGWKGLRLRPDIVGTEDGLAKYPYIRESRRIKAEFTVTELHVGTEARMQATGAAAAVVTAAEFADSVGIGSYNIDLHPSSTGENYIDFGTRPSKSRSGRSCRRMENLLPACKNIGTTHLTNGCYRLHPVEWNIGESVGELAAFAPSAGTPRGPCEKARAARGLPGRLTAAGVPLAWPKDGVAFYPRRLQWTRCLWRRVPSPRGMAQSQPVTCGVRAPRLHQCRLLALWKIQAAPQSSLWYASHSDR